MASATIRDVSHADSHQGRYIVATDTPDGGRSTWPECFGPRGLSGRAYFASDSLELAVANLKRHAFIIDRQTGREVGRKRIAEATPAESE
jgi:hypothetical protein